MLHEPEFCVPKLKIFDVVAIKIEDHRSLWEDYEVVSLDYSYYVLYTTPPSKKTATKMSATTERKAGAKAKVSNGSVDWATADTAQATEYLRQKGYLELGVHLTVSVAKTAMVLLRIAASGGGAAMNDAIRAVAVLVETKWIDRLSEDIRDEVAMLVEAVAEETDMTKESGDYGSPRADFESPGMDFESPI
ncbi:hypothetical protein C8J57DRAFT_1242827 [Mycena rebaudengoi]|nr:hypothetical protein C8J57DRAFT_1242827 [Mycena rebaudengoi]